METLAYLHLALAHEAPLDADSSASTATWESLKLFGRGAVDYIWWTQKKLSTTATVSLLSLSVTLGILGMASQALAAVQEGDRGTEVTTVQQRLQELGYFKANITGYFGPLTKEAVMQFQQAKGLVPDGIVGENTLTALGGQSQTRSKAMRLPSPSPVRRLSPNPVRESATRILQLGDRGRQVSVLQESLAAAGFPSSTNGIFDEKTQKAVMRFQQAKGLVVDGIVGPQTLAALPAVGGSNPSSTARITRRRSTPRTSTTTRSNTSRTTANRSTPNPTANRSTPKPTATRLNISSSTINRSSTQALQKRLQELGFYQGEIDGIWGPQSQAALEAAQRVYDVNATDTQQGRI